jgi:hypothetical protein
MPHEVELIATIPIRFAPVFPFGFIAIRLGLPPLVAYHRESVYRPIDAGIRGPSSAACHVPPMSRLSTVLSLPRLAGMTSVNF